MSPTLQLTAIAAMDHNRVIGHQGKMPWHYPEDLKFFKHTTLSHPVLMGRSTFESIGRPLPGRINIVLSTSMSPRPDLLVLRSMEDALHFLRDKPQAFVIGGAQVYQQALPHCDRVLITLVPGEYEGDTFMPAFEQDFDLEAEGDGETVRFLAYKRKPLSYAQVPQS